MTMTRRGLLLILSSPSGAGKSTLSRRLMAWDQDLSFSVSATTRGPRTGEVDGREYYFKTRAAFQAMVKDGQMLEHAEVFGNFYGSPRGPVEDAMTQGRDTLFDIDWQGARQIKEKFSTDQIVSIFILPPSIQELERRLRARAQDPEEIVQARMHEARNEISHYEEYDFMVVNDDLNSSYQKIRSIIEAKRVARQNPDDIKKFVNQFS